jgi:hypothetical protein
MTAACFCEVTVPPIVNLNKTQSIAVDAGLGVVYLQDDASNIHVLRFLDTD